MISLWFVTPAWKRYGLSEVCFAQRAYAMCALREHGIDARCVVVADDENLDLARGVGFDTVERDNDWLGRRFNDGYEHACREGADYVVPVGSDTWLDPDLFAILPDDGTVLATRSYAMVRSDGGKLAEITLRGQWGYGAWAIPRSLLEPVKSRPCKPRISRGCDGSAFRSIQRKNRGLAFAETFLHPLASVGFRSAEAQITAYDRFAESATERDDPFGILAERYPAEIVAAVRKVYVQ